MSQAMNSAMSGMNAAQQQIAVVSDNIANLNTVAFKESSVTFQDVWYQTKTAGAAPTGSRGGTNGFQVGIGTSVGTISRNFEPSVINTTGKASDLFIQGNGFFTVLSPDGAMYYTRAGNFTLDPNGNLVTQNGYRVMGTSSDLALTSSGVPVKIPQVLEANPTAQSEAKFGTKYPEDMNDSNITPGFFYITPSLAGVKDAEIAIEVKSGLTMAELALDITAQLSAVPGYSDAECVLGDGTIGFVTGAGADAFAFRTGDTNFIQETQISLSPPVSTPGGSVYTSKVLDWTVDIQPFNNLKDALTLASYSISDNGVIEATYSNGDKITVFTDPNTQSKLFKYTTSTGVEIMGPSDCTASPFVLLPENLQIQFASITNPNGLIGIGSNLFTTGPNVGRIVYTIGDSNGVGAVRAGGLETSNVDLARQFSNMITAQRAIEANSRVFDTANSILQTLVYLGRG